MTELQTPDPYCTCQDCIDARRETVRFCGSCGEREGSVYAKHCCTDDNMIED